MVKYDRKNKLFRDFDKMLEEIMEHDTEDISNDSLEIEAEEVSCDSLVSQESVLSSSQELEFIPGQSYSITGGKITLLENSEDFPEEESETEIQITADQLGKMTIGTRKEYNDSTSNIVRPVTRKKTQRRCPNFDD